MPSITTPRFVNRLARSILYDGFGKTWVKSARLKQFRYFQQLLHPYQTNHSMVRIGGDHDGGYLVPNDLEGISACFSPGTGQTYQFEMDCHNQGMQVFMLDDSVDRPPDLPADIYFQRRRLDAFTDAGRITLDDWVRESDVPADSDLLLQIDIEDHERIILPSVSADLLGRTRILVIELHWLENYLSKSVLSPMIEVLERLRQTHIPVHLHPNNFKDPISWRGLTIYPALEVTFLRKDRVAHQQPVQASRHPLDMDTVPSRPSIELANDWMASF